MNSFLYLIAVLFLFSLPLRAVKAALPPPPSKETLDALKRAGDANLEKYGDGGVTLINGEYVIKAKATPMPTATNTPTPLPTNTPTPIPSPSPTPTPQSIPTLVITKTQHAFDSVWQFFVGIFRTSSSKRSK